MKYFQRKIDKRMDFNDLIINKEVRSYNIAEIGINHNGDINLAKELIKIANDIGFDAVKFQKRVPEDCVPINKKNEIRVTPWGKITYLEYKERIEFSKKEYDEIDLYCRELGIDWSASAWDIKSIKFLNKYNLPFIKVPSDKCSDIEFINALQEIKMPIIISIGGTDLDQLESILNILKDKKIIVLQCTSIYPCPTDKVNLRVMNTIKKRFNIPVGFSSHHTSPLIPAMAVAYGAKITEVHVTLDRAMWGTDQAMSLEPRGMQVLINTIKDFEISLGSKNKKITDDEEKTLSRTVGR